MARNLSLGSSFLILTSIFVLALSDKQCRDLYKRSCRFWARGGYCDDPDYIPSMQRSCRKTCNLCERPKCVDLIGKSTCLGWADDGLCSEGSVSLLCSYTCKLCQTSAEYCPALTVKHGYFLRDGVTINPSRVPKKDVHSLTRPGDIVTVVCKEGYKMVGKSHVTCQNTGEYDDDLGVCIHRGECKVPLYDISYNLLDRYYLVGADPDAQNYVPPGTFIAMVCLHNDRKLESRCSGYGQWNPPLLDCTDDSKYWSKWYPSKDQEDNRTKKRHLKQKS